MCHRLIFSSLKVASWGLLRWNRTCSEPVPRYTLYYPCAFAFWLATNWTSESMKFKLVFFSRASFLVELQVQTPAQVPNPILISQRSRQCFYIQFCIVSACTIGHSLWSTCLIGECRSISRRRNVRRGVCPVAGRPWPAHGRATRSSARSLAG